MANTTMKSGWVSIMQSNSYVPKAERDDQLNNTHFPSAGYIKVTGTDDCLSLTKDHALTAEPCPSFTEEIKAGNKFAWFKDKRNSAMWAYGGDADAKESNGLNFDATNLQTDGKTLTGLPFHENPLDNVFISIEYVGLGHTSKSPTGCE